MGERDGVSDGVSDGGRGDDFLSCLVRLEQEAKMND